MCREDGVYFMSKQIDFKNRDRFIQLGIAIAALRKMRGMSQEQLAEKSNVSRSHISAIEAPGLVRPFSLDVFFNIADALEIDPADLINATVFPDKIFKNVLLFVFTFICRSSKILLLFHFPLQKLC